jgi:hypothetical protein
LCILKENNEGLNLGKQGANEKCRFHNIQDVYAETVTRAGQADVDWKRRKK